MDKCRHRSIPHFPVLFHWVWQMSSARWCLQAGCSLPDMPKLGQCIAGQFCIPELERWRTSESTRPFILPFFCSSLNKDETFRSILSSLCAIYTVSHLPARVVVCFTNSFGLSSCSELPTGWRSWNIHISGKDLLVTGCLDKNRGEL